jgi:hypothetical protein
MSVWRCLRTSRNEGKSSDLINQEGWNQPAEMRRGMRAAMRIVRIVQTSSTSKPSILTRTVILRAVSGWGRARPFSGGGRTTTPFPAVSGGRCAHYFLTYHLAAARIRVTFSLSSVSALQLTCQKALEARNIVSGRTANWHFDVSEAQVGLTLLPQHRATRGETDSRLHFGGWPIFGRVRSTGPGRARRCARNPEQGPDLAGSQSFSTRGNRDSRSCE